jgi:transcriptional regulator with XRE-family HTH domain
VFIERLKRFRKSKKLTHEDMAKYLGISRQGYGNYEKGIREPDNETMGKLAELFETTVDYLLGREEKKLSFLTDPQKIELYEAINKLNDDNTKFVLEFVKKLPKKES